MMKYWNKDFSGKNTSVLREKNFFKILNIPE